MRKVSDWSVCVSRIEREVAKMDGSVATRDCEEVYMVAVEQAMDASDVDVEPESLREHWAGV